MATLFAQYEKKNHTIMCMPPGEYIGQIRKQSKNFMPAIIHAVNKVAEDMGETSLDTREYRCIKELTVNDIMELSLSEHGWDVSQWFGVTGLCLNRG